MLHKDYCHIIISGLCNSPDHLLPDYFKREIKKLQAKDYTPAEIEYNLRLVLDLMKDAVRHSFESSMNRFEEYESKDRELPLKKRIQYPKPDLDSTQIFQLDFPKSGSIVRFPGGRLYFLKDFKTVEEALNHVFGKSESGAITEANEFLIPKAVEPFFEILKDYFDSKNHDELKRILATGKKTGQKLLFRSRGNRLSDSFKQLHEHDMIAGLSKKALIQRIIECFMFDHKGKPKPFKIETVERVVSGKQNPCKNPIITVEEGEIIKTYPAPTNPRRNW
jgi:hypothetical protein